MSQLAMMQENKIIVGCMRLNAAKDKDAFLDYAIESGIRYFDHADIYGKGECERLFGEYLKKHQAIRDQLIIQSKCSIVPGVMYDCSKEHIIKSVEASLKRLQTEYLDVLLLHRPDALMEPEEVASAFAYLEERQMVRNFGVSNFNTMQIQLLQKYTKSKLIANQLQFSVAHTAMLTSGTQTNMYTQGAIHRDGGILDYCRLEDITIQAWSPLQYGMIKGTFLTNPDYQVLNDKLAEIAASYEVSAATIAIAWILRHPAKMQVISGTMDQRHFDEMMDATKITLTREEWYEIYLAAGNLLP